MKKILFSFILVSGFAIAANAQSNNAATSSDVQVQSAGQTVTESAAPAAVSESDAAKSNCGSKMSATGSKKSCCAHGQKTAANCGDKKSDMKKEEKISE